MNVQKYGHGFGAYDNTQMHIIPENNAITFAPLLPVIKWILDPFVQQFMFRIHFSPQLCCLCYAQNVEKRMVKRRLLPYLLSNLFPALRQSSGNKAK